MYQILLVFPGCPLTLKPAILLTPGPRISEILLGRLKQGECRRLLPLCDLLSGWHLSTSVVREAAGRGRLVHLVK